MDQIAHNSKILDLVQIDVAKIKREGGDGIIGVIQKEMEEFKKKMEEAQQQQIKKQAFNDRKGYARLYIFVDLTQIKVIPKYPSQDHAQILEKFKEHELRLSVMETKLKDIDTRFLQQDNSIQNLNTVIQEQDERQFTAEKRINGLDDKINSATAAYIVSQSSSTVNNGHTREEPTGGSFKKKRKNHQSPERHLEIGNKLKNMVNQGSGGVHAAAPVKLEEVNFEQQSPSVKQVNDLKLTT